MEIERKWKLSQLPENLESANQAEIKQGYLCIDNGELRLRSKNGRCFMTAKGDGSLCRDEWETEIPEWVFLQLWPQCQDRVLEKTRYSLPYGDLTLEIDEYRGTLSGLVVLEVEFASEAEAEQFDVTAVVTSALDVTADKRYKNKSLAAKGLP